MRTAMHPLHETSGHSRARFQRVATCGVLVERTSTTNLRPADYTGGTQISLTEPGYALLHQYTQPHLYDERDLERNAALAAFWADSSAVAGMVATMIEDAVADYCDAVGKYAWPCPTCRHAVFTRDLGDACPVCS